MPLTHARPRSSHQERGPEAPIRSLIILLHSINGRRKYTATRGIRKWKRTLTELVGNSTDGQSWVRGDVT